MTTMLSGNSMVIAKADEEGTGTVSVSLSAEQTESLKTGGIHTVGVAAKNNTASTAILKIYLRNQDNSAATDIETPDFQTEGLDTEWKTDKDDNGNITSRYLQASLPAGAEANFNLELQYDLPDNATGSYEKKVNVEANAYVDDKDVTEAAADESKDNKVTVVWSGDTDVTEISETMDGMAKLASSGTLTPGKDWLYLEAKNGSIDWSQNSPDIYLYYQRASDWGIVEFELWDTANAIYRVKIPDDMTSGGDFILKRIKADGDKNSWNKEVCWNRCPAEDKGNLSLSDAPTGCNTFKLTDWNSGEWASGVWYTSNYANGSLYFINMDTEEPDFTPTAEFTVSGGSSESCSMPMSKVDGKLYKVIIPDGADYDQVTFKKGSEDLDTQQILNGSGNTYDPESTNTYYYKATEGNSIRSYWDICPAGTNSLAGRTLYLDSSAFDGVNCKLKISEKEYAFTSNNGTYSITIPETSGATQKSILTVVSGNIDYNFIWNNIGENKIILDNGIAKISGRMGGYTLYFDATLSKLNYNNSREVDNQEAYGIPRANSDNEYTGVGYGQVYYSIKRSNGGYSYGSVPAVAGSSYNLYEIGNLDENCIKIKFSNYELNDGNKDTMPGIGGYTTDWLDIPWTQYASPCFYADTSDSTIYDEGYRDGYWDEKGSIRDAEKGKHTDVVDIPSGIFTRDEDVLYVNTTLYDYYSDYELNGTNRDSYKPDATVTSHRIYQPFRQFDQALSDYYKAKSLNERSSSLLYWGNFQNFTGSSYKEIAGTLGLLGFEFGTITEGSGSGNYHTSTSDIYKKFFYENNSMFARDGTKLTDGKSATQGLVSKTLQNGNLILANGAVAPFFNEEFLDGENSKNTVLGEVYKDVTFPFVKTRIEGTSSDGRTGTVDYWCFDSADQNLKNKNLQLTYDSNSGYFMKASDSPVKGRTTSGETTNGNYFPFNTSEQSGNAATLNYGFGQKFEIDFRLTDDGTVVADKTNEIDEDVKLPIEFKFSGDDDVWVFIDDQLILDVGGGHGVVEGTINFQNKTATVSSVKNTSGSGATGNKVYDFSGTFGGDFYKEQHTLTMFYMERGLWESNMKITFNMPDSNKLTVEKEVDTADVDSLFTKCFADKSLLQFPIHIQNYATSGNEKEVTSTGNLIEPIMFNGTASPTSPANTFVSSTETKGSQTAEYYWFAKEYNTNQAYTQKRLGEITSDSPVNVSKASYLQFEVYYDGGETPALNKTYVQLTDANGASVGGYLEGKIVGKPNMQTGTWIKLKVNLSLLTSVGENATFDWKNVRKVAFQYDESRNIYLRELQFIGSGNASTTLTGFTTQQEDIPTYGSIRANALMNAAGAIYRLSGNGQVDQSLNVDQDGIFILKDGQSAVFSDQFRRGSYIYLEEYVNSSVFDTTWTLYENDKEITTMTDDNAVEVTAGKVVTNVEGTVVDDGRKETGNTNVDHPTVPTMVFRSYQFPSSATSLINTKVKYVNSVKTGGLVVKKQQAENSDVLTGDYTFTIKFENVAGMGLETSLDVPIEQTFTLKAGEEKMFSGIPAGTKYTITETISETDVSLEDITINDNNDTTSKDVSNKNVTGIVTADTSDTEYMVAAFSNTKIPKTYVTVRKEWKDSEGNEIPASDLPDSVNVRLQKKVNETWTDVEGTDVTLSEQIGWTYTYSGLDKYVNYDASPQVGNQYRVVEVKDGTVVQDTVTLEDNEYKVSYSVAQANDGWNSSITNTIQPKTILKITKVDAEDTSTKLGGVEFTLTKLDDDRFKVVATTGNDETKVDEFGVVKFENLENGTYILTETKAKEGYSLLKEPITIVINRPYGATIDADKYLENQIMNNTIAITISNRAQFDLPATGGYGRYIVILGGLALAGLGLLMYRLQKRRKGGLNSQ